jgi:hypothetical protein
MLFRQMSTPPQYSSEFQPVLTKFAQSEIPIPVAIPGLVTGGSAGTPRGGGLSGTTTPGRPGVGLGGNVITGWPHHGRSGGMTYPGGGPSEGGRGTIGTMSWGGGAGFPGYSICGGTGFPSRPSGSVALTGSAPTNPYRFSPPISSIKSRQSHRPQSRLRQR